MSCRKGSGGLTMRQWRHEPPAPSFWAKKSAQHSDSVQIFEVINLWHCDLKTHTFPHFQNPPACQNALKLTYSNVKFQNFSGEDPGPTAFRGRTSGPPGRGREERRRAGRGMEGREEGRGREWRGGVDPWPPAPKTIIRHCTTRLKRVSVTTKRLSPKLRYVSGMTNVYEWDQLSSRFYCRIFPCIRLVLSDEGSYLVDDQCQRRDSIVSWPDNGWCTRHAATSRSETDATRTWCDHHA